MADHKARVADEQCKYCIHKHVCKFKSSYSVIQKKLTTLMNGTIEDGFERLNEDIEAMGLNACLHCGLFGPLLGVREKF